MDESAPAKSGQASGSQPLSPRGSQTQARDEKVQALLVRIFRDPLERNRDTMLVSYTAYLTSDEMAELLIQEFDRELDELLSTPLSERRPTKMTVPQRLVRFLEAWLQRYPPSDLSLAMRQKLSNALSRDPQTPPEIRQLLLTSGTSEDVGESLDESSALLQSSSAGVLTARHLSGGGVTVSGGSEGLSRVRLEVSARRIAALEAATRWRQLAQPLSALADGDAIAPLWRKSPSELMKLVPDLACALTYTAWIMYSRLRVDEFVEMRWQSDPGHCANVTGMIQRFQTLSYWVAGTVVSARDVAEATAFCEFFLHLATELLGQRDFDSSYAVFSGLSMVSVTRLKGTWAGVTREGKARLARLNEMLGHKHNARTYRTELEREAGTKPSVPQISLFLRDVIVLYEGNESFYSSGMVNFDRLLLLSDVVQRLFRFKAVPYGMDHSTPELISACARLMAVADEDRLYMLSNLLEPNESLRSAASPQTSGLLLGNSPTNPHSSGGNMLSATDESSKISDQARKCVKMFWGKYRLQGDVSGSWTNNGSRMLLLPPCVLSAGFGIPDECLHALGWTSAADLTAPMYDMGYLIGYARASVLAEDNDDFRVLDVRGQLDALLLDARMLGLGPLTLLSTVSVLKPQASSFRAVVELNYLSSSSSSSSLSSSASSAAPHSSSTQPSNVVAAAAASSVPLFSVRATTESPLFAGYLAGLTGYLFKSLDMVFVPLHTTSSNDDSSLSSRLFLATPAGTFRSHVREVVALLDLNTSAEAVLVPPVPMDASTLAAMKARAAATKKAKPNSKARWFASSSSSADDTYAEARNLLLKLPMGTKSLSYSRSRQLWKVADGAVVMLPMLGVFGDGLDRLRSMSGLPRQDADAYFMLLTQEFGRLMGAVLHARLAQIGGSGLLPPSLNNAYYGLSVLRAVGLGLAQWRELGVPAPGSPAKSLALEVVAADSLESADHIQFQECHNCWKLPSRRLSVNFCCCTVYFGALAALYSLALGTPCIPVEFECRAVRYDACRALLGNHAALKSALPQLLKAARPDLKPLAVEHAYSKLFSLT